VSPVAVADALRSLGPHVPHLSVFDIDPDATSGYTVVTWSPHAPIRGPKWSDDARTALERLPEGGLLVGYLGYEAGRWCERMPHPDQPRPLPDVHLRPTDGHLRYHTATGRWTTHGTPAFQAQARTLLAAAQMGPLPSPLQSPEPLSGPRQAYRAAVRHALSQIHDGEVYQVNLAWEARTHPLPHPLSAWLALRHHNPARRGAFIQVDHHHAVLSNSPELFLHVFHSEGGLAVRSIPIKGTVRASEGPAGRDHLEASEKERAELTMIVDLVRNDLGRVAPWGGVRAGPRVLHTCGDLVHAEQEVVATLRTGLDAIDAVQAAFPPGSVTGAPKVRAMSLIHALEAHPRGVYTGAIGFFAPDGTAHLNVAIRTITCTPHHTGFHIGAGIVADSDPDAEWEETRAKGGRIHAVLATATRSEPTP